MAIITKAIKLETTQQNLIQAVIAKQNDCNSRFLKVTFLNEGTTIPLDSSSDVTINAERKDGSSKSFFGVVNSDDTATVPLHSWILELDGEVSCDISIIDAGSKLTTTTFVVKVEKAANTGDDISSDPQYDVLANLITEVNASKQGVGNALKGSAKKTKVVLKDVSPLPHDISVKVLNEAKKVFLSNLDTDSYDYNFKNGYGDYVVSSVEDYDGYYNVHFEDGSYCESHLDYQPSVGDIVRYEDNDGWNYLYGIQGFSGDPTTVKVTVSGVMESIYLGSPANGDASGSCFDSGETEFIVDHIELDYDEYHYIYFTDGSDYYGTIGGLSPDDIKAGDQAFISYTYDEAYGEDVPEFYLRKGEYREPIDYTPNADGTVNGIVGTGEDMTISNDKGAILEVAYNRDINKAFQSLLNALASANVE